MDTDPRLELERRLNALLSFLDVTSPDLHNRFEERIRASGSLARLEALERELLAALRPAGSSRDREDGPPRDIGRPDR